MNYGSALADRLTQMSPRDLQLHTFCLISSHLGTARKSQQI